MKKILYVTFLIILSSFLVSCNAPQKESEKTVYAMGTIMELKAYGENGFAALDAAEKEIMRLDRLLSRGNDDSEITKLNLLGTYNISHETADIINKSIELAKTTDGAFDITLAPISDLWGFYKQDYRVPSEDEITKELERVGSDKILIDGGRVTLQSGAKLDLGAIAKGYLSARIIEIFKNCGVASGIVSLGGNVHTLGTKPDKTPWRVGIQNPDGGILGTVCVSNKAVITSGGYQRFFEKDGQIYHHIINPKTGRPAKSGVKSVTIIGGDSTLADGLSTAVFVMGLDKGLECLKKFDGFDAVILTDDGNIYISSGLKDIFESEHNFTVIE